MLSLYSGAWIGALTVLCWTRLFQRCLSFVCGTLVSVPAADKFVSLPNHVFVSFPVNEPLPSLRAHGIVTNNGLGILHWLLSTWCSTCRNMHSSSSDGRERSAITCHSCSVTRSNSIGDQRVALACMAFSYVSEDFALPVSNIPTSRAEMGDLAQGCLTAGFIAWAKKTAFL